LIPEDTTKLANGDFQNIMLIELFLFGLGKGSVDDGADELVFQLGFQPGETLVLMIVVKFALFEVKHV